MWPREDWNDTFSCYLPLGGHIVMRRRRQNRFKNFKRHHWLIFFCITVLQILFSIDMSSLFLPPVMCCKYTYELSAKKNYQIWYGSFPVRCHSDIRRSSDWWNNMLEEMSRTRGSSANISGNTLRPALAGLWLLLDLRAPSIFFTQE